MRKISKLNAAKITGLHGKMNLIKSQYNGLISDLDSQIQNLVEEFNAKNSERLEELQTAYSETAVELRGVVLDQVNLMETYIGDRSDTWLDGDSGFDYRYWSEVWEEFGDFLEIAEYQEFDIQIKLETLEIEELPPFNPNLK
ncbi:hypothetical protein [Vibrio anguillarum]|uniref:Uncharacterized protein n=2 Tax=Vibrio anguillarum TaxID=55601 RepID=A0AAW4BPQ8_VIBAN|nr:hypothetical protein [Vibrio anguillarum]MBF4374441.1 hypothetical protein [Vibrio anguillarum]MBF4436963.1 hypothetical protein [Vibrio anguillarum]